MNLILDCRERKLIKYIEANEIPHSVESLTLGDICIKNTEGQMVALFERKTIQDLLSSISDGRYEEQSYRLLECGLPKNRVFYIIEGNIENYVGKGSGLYSKSTVHGCLFSLTFMKGFSLLCSNSLTHTCDIIIKFFKKLQSEPSLIEKAREATYLDSVKLTKTSNMSDEMVTVMMLAQIPKVSKNAAETIMKKYDFNISSLVKALEEEPSCLDEIYSEIANNKKRKLSKPCIANVKKYLHTIGGQK